MTTYTFTRDSVNAAITEIINKSTSLDEMIQQAAIGVIFLAEEHNCAILANRLVASFPKTGSRRKVLTAFLLKFGKFARNNGADADDAPLKFKAKGKTDLAGAEATKWSEFKAENGAAKKEEKTASQKLETYAGKIKESGVSASEAMAIFCKTWAISEEQAQAIADILAQ